MSSDWDEEEEDQAIDKYQKQPQSSPNFFPMTTKTQRPPKPFIIKYFDSMSSEMPIMYMSKEKHRCDIVRAQQELNTTEC